MNEDLQKIDNALVRFSTVEAGLATLAGLYKGVVYDVTTTAGMEDAKAARRAIREPRLQVEQIRKEAKAPILQLGRTLDAHAQRITAALVGLEEPIDKQIKAEEERKEREKQERIAAEAARVQKIQERITELRGVVSLPFRDNAALVMEHIGDIERIEIDASFAEFQDAAADAKAASLARLREIHAGIVERESERRRIAAERAELERLRAEQAERDRIEREQRAEEERVAKAARLAEVRAQEEALRLEREALAAQQREQERIAEEERATLAAERAELERQQAALSAPKPTREARPTDQEIIAVVAAHWSVKPEVAAGWLARMKAVA